MEQSRPPLFTPHGEERTCPVCRRRQWVPMCELLKWQTCSQSCKSVMGQRSRAWNALQRRCLDYMVDQRLTLPEVAQATDINYSVLKAWFRRKDSGLRASALASLAGFLGIGSEQALREAGGRTTEERRSTAASRTMWDRLQNPETKRKAREASARAQRGGTKRAEAIEKRQATRKENGAYDRTLAELGAQRRSERARVTQALFGRLRHEPTPAPETLKEWATVAGALFKLPAEAVRAIWRPYLQERGLTRAGGRPRETRRHELILGLLRARGLTPSGRKPHGFWKDAQRAARESLGAQAPTYTDLQRYWAEHLPTCAICAAYRPGEIIENPSG